MSDELATLLCEAFNDGSGSITPPIVQSSLFSFDSYEAFEDRMAGRSKNAIYSRVDNPTVAAFEASIARAEGADAAIGFGSGMGAISSTLLALVKPGDHVACVEHVYPDAYRMFERLLRPFGVNISYHPVSEFDSDPDLLAGVDVAYLESPNSLMFETMNLSRVADYAKQHGALTIVDNSWATPVFQRPIEHGIDIVLHSASKYISGHSDTVAGVVTASHDLVNRVRDLTLPLLGSKLAPFEAWLLVRGLRTLVPRMQRHQASTNQIIDLLRSLDGVESVLTPDIDVNGGIIGRSGLFSVCFDPSVDIRVLCNHLTLFRLGVSWGGFESLALPARVGLAQAGAANSMRRFAVPDNLVRFSIGLESVEDLWGDLESSIGHARQRPASRVSTA